MNQLPSRWETDRLYVRDAALETDLESLQRLWERSAYMGEFDGHPEREQDDMYKYLTEGDLPPSGSVEYFRVQPFFSKETGEMIGYMAVYHGYPEEHTLWVGFFYIDLSVQGQGYGHEVVQHLTLSAKRLGYSRLMLGVALKNWDAVRFWTKGGFDKISHYHGDKRYSTDTFAHLVLEKALAGGTSN